MQSDAKTPEAYMAELPEARKPIMNALRNVILENLPSGFEEIMSYGMLTYVVPHALYPQGYHCDPKQPLPFMSLASQKNFVAVYHGGIYTDEALLNWFKNEYRNQYTSKLDMGKSCIRFKKIVQVPVQLIGELATKITPEAWIARYESKLKR